MTGRGLLHLRMAGGMPRPAGSEVEAAVRRHCAEALAAAGYEVRESRFSYSGFPGRWGTPGAGVLIGLGIVAGAARGRAGDSAGAALTLVGTLAVAGLLGAVVLGLGTRHLPLMREWSANLWATAPGDAPRCWLVAHVDSKSQPVPILVRAAGITVHGLSWLAALLLALGGWLLGVEIGPTAWVAVGAVGALSAIPIVGSVVGSRSAGAVDNASGLAAVIAAAEKLRAMPGVGILVTSAEELGLAGAREWVAGRPRGVALNCDGIDDGGEFVVMHSWKGATGAARVMHARASELAGRARLRRLLPGILVDSVAFTAAGWDSATLSRGSWQTLARIHTRRDDLEALRGSSVDIAADILAAAAQEVSRWS